MMRWFFVTGFCMLLLACSSLPVPTGERIVSVSWVNSNPETIPYIQSTICGAPVPVFYENLNGKSEKSVQVNQAVFKNCRVETTVVSGDQTRSLGTVWIQDPLRNSPVGEYNLRIQLVAGQISEIDLEPIRLLKNRQLKP